MISPPILQVHNVRLSFHGIVALDGVSFDVQRGHIVGLIGPNGAGKTTLFNCLSCFYPIDSGDIRYQGQSLSRRPAHAMGRLGIARTFQNLALFEGMSVLENVLVGGHGSARGSVLGEVFAVPAARQRERMLRSRAHALLRYLDLESTSHHPIASLTLRARKHLELARALMCAPQLLLLDEPAGGLSHEEVGQLEELIRRIHRDYGLTILLVEHRTDLVMRLCDRVVALESGRTMASGTPQAVRSHPKVIDSYLGVSR